MKTSVFRYIILLLGLCQLIVLSPVELNWQTMILALCLVLAFQLHWYFIQSKRLIKGILFVIQALLFVLFLQFKSFPEILMGLSMIICLILAVLTAFMEQTEKDKRNEC